MTTLKQPKNPLVIIQWSCDPMPYDNIPDTIYEKRVQTDIQGLINATLFWKHMKNLSKTISIPKKYKLRTDKINQDMNIKRFEKHDPKGHTQHFFDLLKTDKKSNRLYNSMKINFSKQLTPTINPQHFFECLRNDNVVYLPIHGGHALDEHSPNSSIYTLPEDVYVISFNPPNSSALFMCQEPTNELLQFIIDPYSMILISKADKRKKTFESNFYKNLRIWGPGNTVINRGLVTDREQDLKIKYPNDSSFKYLKKSTLRKVSGQDVEQLYTELINNVARSTKKNIKTKKIKKKKKEKYNS
jgi:hypothetical protein